MARWYQLGLLASAILSVACAGTPEPERIGGVGPIEGSVGRVVVAVVEAGTSVRSRERMERAAPRVRQSARDWLEDAGRLAPGGALSVAATLESVHLRGGLTTWLFAWAAAPDHLAARVEVRRGGSSVAVFPLRVESALAGYSWRDAEERLDRLARRLGRRLAERLESGL